MSGTSLDGLDVVLARMSGEGLAMDAEYVGMHSVPLPDPLRQTLEAMTQGKAHAPLDYMRAARHLGVVHAQACMELMTQLRQPAVDFVVAHGQTVWHAPQDCLSWQLFDPWPLTRTLRRPVCYDLRQADLVAGGQGAPITPMADPILYKDKAQLVLNLGGICNYTSFETCEDVQGADLAVCNIVLDGLAQRLMPGSRFDRDGRCAASGQAVSALVAMFQAKLPGLEENRTLGREDCPDTLLDEMVGLTAAHPTEDVLASAVQAVAMNIGQGIAARAPLDVVLAGGGAKNQALVSALRTGDGGGNRWHLSDDLGIPCEAREALAFAVLGALSQDGVPITLPGVTGASEPGVAGAWAGLPLRGLTDGGEG